MPARTFALSIAKTALDILHCIDRYITTRNGDVKKLKLPMTGFRLRCGDYRIFFKQTEKMASPSPEFYIAAKLIAKQLPN